MAKLAKNKEIKPRKIKTNLSKFVNSKNFVLSVFIIGCLVLFSYPSPASNLFGYFGTFLFFVVLLVILIRRLKLSKY